jgi:hypothetical protein
MMNTRGAPTIRIPLGFDCAADTRVDLLEGVTITPEGTVSDGKWKVVGTDNELQRAACAEVTHG